MRVNADIGTLMKQAPETIDTYIERAEAKLDSMGLTLIDEERAKFCIEYAKACTRDFDTMMLHNRNRS